MKKQFLLLITALLASCSSTEKITNNGATRVLRTGEIMEMNSEEFLVQNNTWSLETTAHFKFYFDKAISKDMQEKVMKAQELNYQEITALMGLADTPLVKIKFWLFKDAAQKKKLTLVGSDAHAISTFPAVYYLPKNATGAQEVGHAITQKFWGFIPKTSNYALVLDEGFNYYIDNERFYQQKLMEKVKVQHAIRPINIEKVITENDGQRARGVTTGSHEVDESLISGAFVQFLVEAYGADKFSMLWKKAVTNQKADVAIFEEVYQKNITELANNFIALLN